MGTFNKNGDPLGIQKLKKVHIGTRVPKWGPTWEQWEPFRDPNGQKGPRSLNRYSLGWSATIYIVIMHTDAFRKFLFRLKVWDFKALTYLKKKDIKSGYPPPSP